MQPNDGDGSGEARARRNGFLLNFIASTVQCLPPPIRFLQPPFASMSVRATVSSASKCIFANRLSVGPIRTAIRLLSSSNSEGGQHGAPNTPAARRSTQERSESYLPLPSPNTIRSVKKRRSFRSKFQDGEDGPRSSGSRPPKPFKSPGRAKKAGGRSSSLSTRPPSPRDKIKSHPKTRDGGAAAHSLDSDKNSNSGSVKSGPKARVVCAFEVPFATETLVGTKSDSETICLSDILRVTPSIPTTPCGYFGTRFGPCSVQVSFPPPFAQC